MLAGALLARLAWDVRSEPSGGMTKLNYWELKGRGRGPGGEREGELGRWPAAQPSPLDSVHGGRNAGRACWVFAGTLRGNEVQDSLASEYDDCRECDFHKRVRTEERPDLVSPVLNIMMAQ